MTGITDRMKARYLRYKNMPSSVPYTSASDIRARQFGALRSFAFEPVMPVSVAAPVFRPLFMKVSS